MSYIPKTPWFRIKIEMVEERSMPLESYTWTHKEAKLTPEQIEQLTAWVNQARTQLTE